MRYITFVCIICMACHIHAKTISFEESITYGINSTFASEAERNRSEIIGSQLDDITISNPELSVEYTPDNHAHEIWISQPIHISSITLARNSYKQLLKRIDSFEKQLDLLQVYHQVSLLYYELYIMQEEARYMQEQLNFLNKVSRIVHGSINKNNLSLGEIDAFDADVLSARMEVNRINETLSGQRLLFIQALKLPYNTVSLDKPPLISVPASLDSILSNLETYPSKRKMLSMRYQQAKEQVSISKQDRFAPIIAPKIGFGNDNFEKKSEWKIGVSVSIPLWNRNAGRHDALKANERFLKSELEALENVSFEEIITRTHKKLTSQIEAVNNYQTRILPSYARSLNRIEASFLRGQISIFDVWQIREKYTQAQGQSLTALKNAVLAKIELEQLIGTRLEDIQ